MISVDEMALVKERLDGLKLSASAAGSMRQLELLFLVAHDEVTRLEKFESRARLVSDKWELLRAAKLLAAQHNESGSGAFVPSAALPAGFSATTDDFARCVRALETLFGKKMTAASHVDDKKEDADNDNNNDSGDAADQQRHLPPVVAHTKRRQPNPAVYVDDEFTYDDDETAVATHNNNSGFGTPSQSPHRPSRGGDHSGGEDNESATLSSVPSPSESPKRDKHQQNNEHNINEQHQSREDAFVDRLACCKFISALPLAAYQLAFHREGDYAAVALAAALDELKLFEAQLRSSQESFVNLRACWNHELAALSTRSGVDLFAARVQESPEALKAEEGVTQTTNRSAAPRVDSLAAAETADGGSWQAPPLVPLAKRFSPDADDLFAGYVGPTLLGPVVSRHTLRHELADMAVRKVESNEDSAREHIDNEAAAVFAQIMADRAVRGEALWTEALYQKSAADLRVLEMKEEMRRLKQQLANSGAEGLAKAVESVSPARTAAAAASENDEAAAAATN